MAKLYDIINEVKCTLVVRKETSSKRCITQLSKELLALEGVVAANVRVDRPAATLAVDVKGGSVDEIGGVISKHRTPGYTTVGNVRVVVAYHNYCSEVRFNYTADQSSGIDVGLLRSIAEYSLKGLNDKERVIQLSSNWYEYTKNKLAVIGQTPQTIIMGGDDKDFDKFKALCENFISDSVNVVYVK